MAGMNQYFEDEKDPVNKTGEHCEMPEVEGATKSLRQCGPLPKWLPRYWSAQRLAAGNPHVTPIENNEIVPPAPTSTLACAGGTMVALGGGKLVREAGYANECSAAQLAGYYARRIFFYINFTTACRKHAHAWSRLRVAHA